MKPKKDKSYSPIWIKCCLLSQRKRVDREGIGQPRPHQRELSEQDRGRRQLFLSLSLVYFQSVGDSPFSTV